MRGPVAITEVDMAMFLKWATPDGDEYSRPYTNNGYGYRCAVKAGEIIKRQLPDCRVWLEDGMGIQTFESSNVEPEPEPEPEVLPEGLCECCRTYHGAERNCREADLDDCSPGYMRSDRYQL
jgi:hypothetical protein